MGKRQGRNRVDSRVSNLEAGFHILLYLVDKFPLRRRGENRGVLQTLEGVPYHPEVNELFGHFLQRSPLPDHPQRYLSPRVPGFWWLGWLVGTDNSPFFRSRSPSQASVHGGSSIPTDVLGRKPLLVAYTQIMLLPRHRIALEEHGQPHFVYA